MMKNWVFDLQRFAVSVSSWAITGPTTGTTYYEIDNGVVKTSAAGTPYDTTKNYIGVTYAAGTPNTYTISVNKPTNTTTMGTTSETVTFADLSFTSGVNANTTITLGTGITATKATLTANTGGDTITYGGFTYTSAALAKSITVEYSNSKYYATLVGQAATNTLALTSGTNEIVAADTGTTIVVGSDGTVSDLSAGDTFAIGSTITAGSITTPAANASQVTYVVDSHAARITAYYVDATGAATTGHYLTTSDISNVTITAKTGTTTVDEMANTLYAKTVTLTVDSDNGTPVTMYGAGDGSNKTVNVYKKDGVVYTAGYTASSLGSAVGTIKANSDGTFAFDAGSSSVGLDMDFAAAATGATLNNVKGGSGKDTVNAANADYAVTINGGAGADTINADVFSNTSIVGGAGNDSILVSDFVNGSTTTTAVGVVIDGGEDNDYVHASADAGTDRSNAWTVLGGAGNDTIDFSALTNGAHTEWSINAGDGNNEVKVGSKVTSSTITAGSGNDSIFSADVTNVIVTGSGKDVVSLNGAAAANVSDFTYGEDSFYVAIGTDLVTDVNTVARTATGTAVLTTEGVVNYSGIGTNGTATISSSYNFYAATFVNGTDKVDLAWTKDNGTSINAGSLTNKVILTGATNGTEGDLLVGGSKDDTIYAGANDSIYGGAGNDLMTIKGGASAGVYVGLATTSGKDTIQGFTAGFNIDTADSVYLVDGKVEDLVISNDGTDVIVKDGKGTLELDGRGTTTSQKILVGDKKVYSIANNQTLTISDPEELADYYYGTTVSGSSNGSAISLVGYENDITVDLSNAMFKSITSVTGGSGNNTIMGSKANETLYGGVGSTSLYGGAGKDSLVSGTGVTTFFLTTGAGKDSVSGFVTGTNEDTSDVLNIFNAPLTGITRSATNTFTVKVSDTDSLQIAQATDGVDQKIQWVSGAAKGVAKIGMSSQANNFTYEEGVTNYLGGSRNDTISFGSGSDDINLWLDQVSAVSSIETYDASSRSGSVLIAGSSAAAETIRGGSGDSSLWGGNGKTADVLVGNTSGTTSFFYGMGQGSDSISGGSNDTVNLYDMQLSDLASANVDTSNRRVIFTTTAGDTVTVSGGVQNFTVGGTTYQTTYASSTDWTAKA